MRFLIRLSALSALCLLLFTCGPSPSAAATADPVVEEPAPLDVTEDRVMPKDQTEGTARANPEVIDPAKLPEPALVEKLPATEPRQAPESGPKATPAVTGKTTSVATGTPVTTAPPKTSPPAPASAPEKPAVVQDADVEEVPVEVAVQSETDDRPDHADFNRLLKTHVNSTGKVNYAGLKKDEAKLDAYLATLARDAPDRRWERKEALTYWLNAYNAFTIKMILKNYPLKSITDLHGGKPWDVKWIELDGKTYSLNNIEHDIIRPTYKDPRIHFAVVCAATSCPPLANYAFSEDMVGTQLDRLTRNFINNKKFNQTEGNVRVSKIFDWYAEDFGDVAAYLNKYLKTDLSEGVSIGFMDYDWALNKQ